MEDRRSSILDLRSSNLGLLVSLSPCLLVSLSSLRSSMEESMYIPKTFQEDDLGQLQALMRRYSFAVLVTQGGPSSGSGPGGTPFATHLPFVLDAARGQYGTLLAHMARAN